MGIFSFLKDIIKPAAKLVDDLHTSTEEKLQMKAELMRLENEISGKILDYETKLMESRTAIIKAEATSSSWITSSWRPITMLVFLGLVVCDSFGWLTTPLAPQAWTLLQLGLGGYVAGRSLEKITPAISGMMGKGKDSDDAKG